MFSVEDSGLLDGIVAADINFINVDIQVIEIIDKTTKSSPACKIFVSMWLYAIMANYSWILIEGLYLHNLIFLALMAPTLSITRYIVLGWGFPVPFLMSWIVLSSTSPSMLCWTESLNPAYFWIIRGPITASIITNFILFLNITRVVYMKTFSPQSPRHSRYRNLFRSTMILLPLFGVHYTVTTVISTILEKNKKDELTWLQLDQVFSSFQGSVVAFLCCFLNSEVQSALWSIWIKWKITSGYLFTKRKRKCRKHSRARLNSRDNESDITRSSSIATSSDRCRSCGQESHDGTLCQSQQTVVSFFDLETRAEEGAMNQFCNHENTFSVREVQSTSCQVSEESFVPPPLGSDTAITSVSIQSSTPLLQPTESPLSVTTLGEINIKDSITSTSDNDLKSTTCEGSQPSASANDVLFLLRSENLEGSRKNFPCYYGFIAEESSVEPEVITKNINETTSESIHNVAEVITTPPTTCLPIVSQKEGYFNECIDGNSLTQASRNINTPTPNTKALCGCQNTMMNRIGSSSNLTKFAKFHFVVTDANGKTSKEMEFKDGSVVCCETHHLTAELSERIKTSVSFLKPQVSEDEFNLNVFDDANESRLPLCSKQSSGKYRQRSRSEGARWFCSIKKSKTSKDPPECVELNRSDPIIVLTSSGLSSVQLVQSPSEIHGGLRQNHTQQKERKLSENRAEENKIYPENYHQLKTKSVVEDFNQNFRPRSSSYCCKPRQRNLEASPRIPPEWMPKKANETHLTINSDQNTEEFTKNRRLVPFTFPHISQTPNVQGNTFEMHEIPIISCQDYQNVENEDIILREFGFGIAQSAKTSVPRSA